MTPFQTKITILLSAYFMIFIMAMVIGNLYHIYSITNDKQSIINDINNYEVNKTSSGGNLYPTEYWVSWMAVLGLAFGTVVASFYLIKTD